MSLGSLVRDYQQTQDSIAQRVLRWLVGWWAGVSAEDLRRPDRLFAEYERRVTAARQESIRAARAFHDDVRREAGLRALPASMWSTVRPESTAVNDAFFSAVTPARERLDDPDFLAELDRLVAAPLEENTDYTVLEAGRSALAHARDADREVIGYYRKTEANPCGFCAMLASRGLVYKADRNSRRKSRSFLNEQNPDQYHAHCRCQTLPLFRGVSMPREDRRRAEEFKRMWDETPGSGAVQLSNFNKRFREMRENRSE